MFCLIVTSAEGSNDIIFSLCRSLFSKKTISELSTAEFSDTFLYPFDVYNLAFTKYLSLLPVDGAYSSEFVSTQKLGHKPLPQQQTQNSGTRQ